MNKSKIEWCDHTWNPITGCRHDCEYCYARKMTARFAGDVRLNLMAKKDYRLVDAADGGKQVFFLEEPMLNETGHALVYPFGFEPTFHQYRLNTLDGLKMGNNIFVGAMADIFGTWVPDEWIKKVFRECQNRPMHNYMFLTKNPMRYLELAERDELPPGGNMWYGTTVTDEMKPFFFCKGYKTFLSIEPLLGQFTKPERNIGILNKDCKPDWIIIGAETGRRKDKVIPEWDWIKEIVLAADTVGVPVFMKDSLIPIVGEENMRRDFPAELKRKTISKKMQDKLYGECASCKGVQKKSEMITLLARSKRGEQPKQYGFMCRKCFRMSCDDLGLPVPDIEAYRGE